MCAKLERKIYLGYINSVLNPLIYGMVRETLFRLTFHFLIETNSAPLTISICKWWLSTKFATCTARNWPPSTWFKAEIGNEPEKQLVYSRLASTIILYFHIIFEQVKLETLYINFYNFFYLAVERGVSIKLSSHSSSSCSSQFGSRSSSSEVERFSRSSAIDPEVTSFFKVPEELSSKSSSI